RYGDSAVPADATNLARRAVDVLIAALEVDRDVDVLRDIDIVIDKQVPVAGGMGGGRPMPPPRSSGPPTSSGEWPRTSSTTARSLSAPMSPSSCTGARPSAAAAGRSSVPCSPAEPSTG